MTRFIRFFVFIVLISGCSSQTLSDYRTTSPNLSLEAFFDGDLVAYGIVLDRSGTMIRRFEVDLKASWKGTESEIKEWFTFDDGEKTTRIWQLEALGNGQYKGTANDVVGTASGQTSGSALYWRYDLLIPVDGTEYQITLDDWMYLIDEHRLFNKTELTKFGFKVGEVILYIEKK